MVKETKGRNMLLQYFKVSIPSRGSGKGDVNLGLWGLYKEKVSIPSRGSGKGDAAEEKARELLAKEGFNPLSGKW